VFLFEARCYGGNFGAGVDAAHMHCQEAARAILQDFAVAVGVDRNEEVRVQEPVETEIFGGYADDGVPFASNAQVCSQVGGGAVSQDRDGSIVHGKGPAELRAYA
jgi:hypothetical protein